MPAVVHLFEKVVDASVVLWNGGSAGAVHRRLSRLRDHARQALSSSPGGSTPHSARSSNRARQWQLIRAELPSNGYPQPSGSSKNARRQWHFSELRLIKWLLPEPSRTRGLTLFVPFIFLPRLATPALRLGFYWVVATLGLLSFVYCYVVTDAGPASHRVRLWQGGPASTYCRFRWIPAFMLYDVTLTGTRIPRVRLLGHPEVRKRPWPLRRSRGDGNGGRFVRSPCLPSWRGLRLLYVTPDAVPLFPVQQQSIELPATTVGACRRRHSLRRHKGGLWTVRLISVHHVLLQGGFLFCVAGTLWLNEGV